MESKTSFQQSNNTPIPCVKGCGFFGTPATFNMCSKCYRDHLRKEHQASAAITTVPRSMTAVPLSDPVAQKPDEEKNVDEVAGSKKVSNRCGCCNKKVGLLGFKCRCGTTFCGSHRYPEEHGCELNYKSVGKLVVAQENPLVVADKILRF